MSDYNGKIPSPSCEAKQLCALDNINLSLGIILLTQRLGGMFGHLQMLRWRGAWMMIKQLMQKGHQNQVMIILNFKITVPSNKRLDNLRGSPKAFRYVYIIDRLYKNGLQSVTIVRSESESDLKQISSRNHPNIRILNFIQNYIVQRLFCVVLLSSLLIGVFY